MCAVFLGLINCIRQYLANIVAIQCIRLSMGERMGQWLLILKTKV